MLEIANTVFNIVVLTAVIILSIKTRRNLNKRNERR